MSVRGVSCFNTVKPLLLIVLPYIRARTVFFFAKIYVGPNCAEPAVRTNTLPLTTCDRLQPHNKWMLNVEAIDRDVAVIYCDAIKAPRQEMHTHTHVCILFFIFQQSLLLSSSVRQIDVVYRQRPSSGQIVATHRWCVFSILPSPRRIASKSTFVFFAHVYYRVQHPHLSDLKRSSIFIRGTYVCTIKLMMRQFSAITLHSQRAPHTTNPTIILLHCVPTYSSIITSSRLNTTMLLLCPRMNIINNWCIYVKLFLLLFPHSSAAGSLERAWLVNIFVRTTAFFLSVSCCPWPPGTMFLVLYIGLYIYSFIWSRTVPSVHTSKYHIFLISLSLSQSSRLKERRKEKMKPNQQAIYVLRQLSTLLLDIHMYIPPVSKDYKHVCFAIRRQCVQHMWELQLTDRSNKASTPTRTSKEEAQRIKQAKQIKGNPPPLSMREVQPSAQFR